MTPAPLLRRKIWFYKPSQALCLPERAYFCIQPSQSAPDGHRRRLRGFSRKKTVWKTAIFPAFSTQKNGSGPVLKTWGPAIPDWRKINRRSGTVCRMQRKSFDFLFYKRQNACIFIQNFPESGCLNYGAYRADSFLLLKTQWKKWKTSRKTQPFLHKSC